MSLQVPTDPAPFVVVGIDPGTTTLGVSILSWEVDAPLIQVLNAFTLTANDRAASYQSMVEMHGARFARLQQHRDVLYQLFRDVRPNAVIAESPFLKRHPQAFAALTECIYAIRSAVHDYDRHLPFELIDPISAKREVGVTIKRKMHKDDVTQALARRTDVDWGVELATLDEHAVDATAVGLYYYLHYV